jgi:hypothetical protein
MRASRQPWRMLFPLPSEDEIARLAREQLDFDIPAECLPGVRANLAVLGEHLRTIEGASE